MRGSDFAKAEQSAGSGVGRKHGDTIACRSGMNRDRLILRIAIVVLALVIVAQFVANRLESHWRNAYRHPDPRFEQMGRKR